MKLRCRANSVRLRVNQLEVRALAAGTTLAERVPFPGDTELLYLLEPSLEGEPAATFRSGAIRVLVPQARVSQWAGSAEIGLYFNLPAGGATLKVAIEKDLECVDGPLEESDPHAFPRAGGC